MSHIRLIHECTTRHTYDRLLSFNDCIPLSDQTPAPYLVFAADVRGKKTHRYVIGSRKRSAIGRIDRVQPCDHIRELWLVFHLFGDVSERMQLSVTQNKSKLMFSPSFRALFVQKTLCVMQRQQRTPLRPSIDAIRLHYAFSAASLFLAFPTRTASFTLIGIVEESQQQELGLWVSGPVAQNLHLISKRNDL